MRLNSQARALMMRSLDLLHGFRQPVHTVAPNDGVDGRGRRDVGIQDMSRSR